jgi:hypothetical protein
MGINRAVLRDFLPALDGLGLHTLVLMLDAHLPPVHMLLGLERDRLVTEQAGAAVGADEAERLRAVGESLTPATALALLRSEVEVALGLAATSKPAVLDASGQTT